MLDHILLDFVANLKSSLESSMLEKAGVEERFQIDVWLGDISFETSYSLPGEDNPPTRKGENKKGQNDEYGKKKRKNEKKREPK